jgi:hypothetical protein
VQPLLSPDAGKEGGVRPTWRPSALTPQIETAECRDLPHDGCRDLLLGVTTFNRKRYLQRFVESFGETCSRDYRWTLIIGDDGSTDGSVEFARDLRLPGIDVVVIENKARGIAGQTNTILAAARSIGFDFGFMCDDDIYFDGPGWDDLYVRAAVESGVEHLVFHDPSWKPPMHEHRKGALRSFVGAGDCMGCFYTFTPQLLAALGALDEVNFPVRGHSHVDFTHRACRAGFNEASTLWDAEESTRFIRLWSREEYVETIDWAAPEVKRALNDEERARRSALIAEPERIYVPPADPEPWRPGSRVTACGPRAPEVSRALEVVDRLRPPSRTDLLFDQAFVLNLRHQRQRFNSTAGQLATVGIPFERWPGVDGNDEQVVEDWRRYHAVGPITKVERQIGRRAIQSPGAWAYLLGMRGLLQEASRRRLRRIAVFDDDVYLHRSFSDLFDRVAEDLPEEFSLLFLGATQRAWEGVHFAGERLHHPDEHTDGSYAVVIDHSVFSELIERINAFEAPFDAGPLRDIVRSQPERCFVASPSLAIPDVAVSDIRSARDQGEMASLARWKLEDYPSLPTIPPDRLTPPHISVLVDLPPGGWPATRLFQHLREQTFADFEILVLDRSADIYVREAIRGAALGDPRIRLFASEEALDASEALSALAEAARGGVLLPQPFCATPSRVRVERCVEAMRHHPKAAGVASSVEISHPDAGLLRSAPDDAPPRETSPESWLLAGALRADIVTSLGSLLAEDEGGLQELVSRMAAYEEGRGSTASPQVIQLTEALLSVPHQLVSSVVGERDEHPRWMRFHAEIREGRRPPFRSPRHSLSLRELHLRDGSPA